MGCLRSKLSQNHFTRNESFYEDDFFTKEEEEILKEIWALIEPDKSAFGVEILKKLVVNVEQQLSKFYKIMSDSGSCDWDMNMLTRHGEHIVAVFPSVIASIGKMKANNTARQLNEYGVVHYKLGVPAKRLIFLWPIIRKMLSDRLGDQFDSKTELAWKHLFDYIHYHMQEGIHMIKTDKTQNVS